MKFSLLVGTVMAWALWFGATISIFVFGYHLSKALPKEQFGDAAAAMFQAFAVFEWVLGAVAMIGAGLLLVTYPAKSYLAIVFGLFLAIGIMVTVTLGLMPQMKRARVQNPKEWSRLHGQSMAALSIQALVLGALAVPLLAAADPTFRRRERIQEDAAEPVLPKRSGLSRRI